MTDTTLNIIYIVFLLILTAVFCLVLRIKKEYEKKEQRLIHETRNVNEELARWQVQYRALQNKNEQAEEKIKSLESELNARLPIIQPIVRQESKLLRITRTVSVDDLKMIGDCSDGFPGIICFDKCNLNQQQTLLQGHIYNPIIKEIAQNIDQFVTLDFDRKNRKVIATLTIGKKYL